MIYIRYQGSSTIIVENSKSFLTIIYIDKKQKAGYYMTNSVSSNQSEKYNIAAFFSGVGGIELGFEQTNEFRVVYANEFDKYARETYQLNHPDTY